MSRWKGVLRAAAPLTALLLLAAGARLLPSMLGKDDAADEGKLLSTSSAQGKSPSKGKRVAQPPPAPPELVDAQTQAVLQKIVSGQLSAFASNDFARAIRYSSPQFRQTYSPGAFRQMVETMYAGLLTHRSLRFDAARRSADVAMVPVFLKQENGNEASYLYILRRDTAASPLEKKNPPKTTDKSGGASSGDEAVWHVEGVSTLGPGSFPAAEGPNPGSMTDLREL